jgi:predicted acetyltransferase
VSVQDRCIVCAKHNIASEIVLDAPDGTLGDEAQVESRFSPFGDSVSVGTR